MIITLRQAAYLATMAVFGVHNALGSADQAAASNAYASPDKIEKKQHREPEFGFTTSQKTKDAFAALSEENSRLKMRDFQSTALYRNLRNEIVELKKRNKELEAHMEKYHELRGEYRQLHKNYEALVASIDARTNITNRSRANLVTILGNTAKTKEAVKQEAVDFSDDDE